jgi:two-component system sensor histidine kinase UhpB
MLQIEALAAGIPDELQDQLDELRETARHGTEEVRRIARRLRPDALEELGLVSALAALASAFERQAGLPVLRRLELAVAISSDEELVIYRIAQEALTNVARHAEATWVQLELRDSADGIVLTVADNGRGMTADAATSSHGLRGMRERAMLIDATLLIEGRPDGGTVVKLSIPRGARR